MDKEKFFSGLWIIAGLILGSLFTNFIYQDYLAYGGQVQYLVFHNQKLYSASMSLFFYILFKRVKQYAMIYLAGYLLKPWIFLYGFTFSMAFFLGSMLSLQIIQMGMRGLFLVLLSLFPQFILYGMSLILLIKRNFQEEKKEEKDNSKREAVLTDPVTMGWAGTYKDDDSGDRLVIASIGYEWSYVIYTSSGQIFEKESECGAFGDYLEGQYYTFYKNENGLLSVTSGAGKGWGNYRRISGTYTPDLEIEGTYENDTTTMIVYDQMAEASTKYVPTGSDIAAVRVEYNNGLVIEGRLYTQGDGGLSIIDSVSKEIYGIATFENGEVKVTGSGFDGILKSK